MENGVLQPGPKENKIIRFAKENEMLEPDTVENSPSKKSNKSPSGKE